jgi:hypothetical protein
MAQMELASLVRLRYAFAGDSTMRLLPLLPVALALGCQSKISVVATNAKPVATILAPTSGDTAVEGSTYSLRGTAADPTTDPPELVVRWFVDDVEVCAGSVPAEDGLTTCDVEVPAQAAAIRLEVIDPDGAADEATATLGVVGNAAPTATISAPTEATVLYADRLITLDGVVSDAETPAAAIGVAWTSSRDGALITPGPDSEGRVLASVNLSQGEHFLSLTATDANGKSATDSLVVTVGPPNTPPACVFTAPDDGASGELGTLVALRGTASDADVPADWLTASFESNLDGTLGTITPSSAGDIVLASSALSAGTHTLTLRVTDEVGGTCTAVRLYTVGTAPTLTWLSPVASAVLRAGDPVDFEATVADAEDPPTALTLRWTSSIDGDVSAQGADSGGVAAFQAPLSPGNHTLTVRATDPDGLFVERTRSVRVNAAPSAPVLAVAPTPARTEDALVASVTVASVDPEGSNVTLAWSWFKDGSLTGYTGTVVPATATTKGETWTARATPSDGTHAGTPGEASVVIANTAPDVTSAAVTPASAPVGATVTCAATASDPDETAAVTYGWTVNGASVATGATYVLGASGEGRGAAVVCTATARDGDGATDVGVASVTVLNTPPTLASVALAPLDPAAGDSVTCTASGALDADDDAVTVAYAWTRNGQPAGSGDTYSGTLQSGDVLSCTATPNDGAANGTPLSASVSVGNTAPDLFGPVVTPSSAAVGAVLTCAATATDVDGSNPVVTYRWSKGGQPVGTGATYTVLVTDDPTDVLTCTATADDGEGGVTTGTATATVENTAPVLTSLSLTPAQPTRSSVLSCSATATDANGDVPTLTFTFTVDGVPVPNTTTQTARATLQRAFVVGQLVACTVTANDKDGGTDTDTASVVIGNNGPTVGAVTLSPAAPRTNDVLTATAGATDPEGDALTLTYAWSVNGTEVQNGAANTLDGAVHFAKDDVVTVLVTADDGASTGTGSASVTVLNTAPTAPVIAISPEEPVEGDALTCTIVTPSTDADGDAITYAYAWDVDGAASGFTTATVPEGETVADETWSCEVVAGDGRSTGGPATTSALIPASWYLVGQTDFSSSANLPYTLCRGCAGWGCPSIGGGVLTLPADWHSMCASGVPSAAVAVAFEFDLLNERNYRIDSRVREDSAGTASLYSSDTWCWSGGSSVVVGSGYGANSTVGRWRMERHTDGSVNWYLNGILVEETFCPSSGAFEYSVLQITNGSATAPLQGTMDNLQVWAKN